jgi:hypothetical protein
VILLNLFDGTRQPIGAGVKNPLIRIIDGNQKELASRFVKGASVQFSVPFFDNLGDRYTVLASADHFTQAGFTPVNVSPTATQTVDLMLLPKNATFGFADAVWTTIKQSEPAIHAILASGAATEDDAQTRYDDLMENKPATLACLWNLMTSMRDIDLPVGTPLTYLKQLIWQDMPNNIFAPAQDRFYAYADRALVDQVKLATQHGEFAPEMNPNFFHKGATSSFKQIQFGETNVQLTFHENDTKTIDGTDCIVVEPDIDYFKDLAAHALLEALANAITGNLTDPKVVYALRWIAGRHAGVPEFNPPYTIE